MRVLLVHNFYQQTGGEDLVVQSEIAQLTSRGVSVCVYSRHNNELKAYGTVSKALVPFGTVRSSKTRKDLAATIEKFRPDVAWLHNLYPLISSSAYDAFLSAGIPMVQMFHNYRPFCSNGLLLTQGTKCDMCLGANSWHAVRQRCVRDSYSQSVMYATATSISRKRLSGVAAHICPSEFVRSKVVEAGLPESRVHVRPHFLDAAAVAPSPGPGEYVLYLGRLSAEKGVATLLAAFLDLPNIPLVIAGTGPEESRLRRFAGAHSMANVRFVGFQSGKDKWDLIGGAAFVVVPSEWYEIFGMSILEAFAKAKPVLGSRIGAIPDLVQDGLTGMLFEPGDAFDLARKAHDLFERRFELEAMGKRARTIVLENYSPDLAHQRLMEAFRC